jgi:hypothetical protein
MSFVLAHQGGWDEMLLVAAPVAIFVGLLALANRRAERIQSERAQAVASGEIEPGADATDTA